MATRPRGRQGRKRWDGANVKALRDHLSMSQQALADELGTRQQTISDWETGTYTPGGISSRLLSIMAERADFHYNPGSPPAEDLQIS